MTQRYVIFLVNLLQDVSIIRPLVYMAARDMGGNTLLLVTSAFRKRDQEGVWQRELDEIGADTGAGISFYEHDLEALRLLTGKSGVLVAASESHLSAHKLVHDVFRLAPPTFLRVTLQHGFECVGFLQSRDQNLAHGKSITFAADVICGWCEPERLTSLVPSQRPKLLVTGPAAVLQVRPTNPSKSLGMGIVCENMHSPRLNAAGNFKTDFLTIFGEYCEALHAEGKRVTLRPHPGGQYTLKNKVRLANNVKLNNAPIYKVDLSRYAYGISAPSSILIDMVLAGIPAAVWQDSGSVLDIGNYEGLTRISNLQDWLDFSREAVANPEHFIERQQQFLERQKLVRQVEDVYARYAALLQSTVSRQQPGRQLYRKIERVLFVANSNVPTLQLRFVKPLAPLVASGELATGLITEEQITREFGKNAAMENVRAWLRERFDQFQPTIVVFCRYSGLQADYMRELAEEHGAPVVYHIDDDLLHIPKDIGLQKHRFHNRPERLTSVRHLLDSATLVYCTTTRLRKRLEDLFVKAPIVEAGFSGSGSVISKAVSRPVKKIGYMAGSDHSHDFNIVLGAIQRIMRSYSKIHFEFFGSISVPEQLKEFGERVTHIPKIDNYEEFFLHFAKYEWDIGICPLTPIHFNLMKTDIKWVDYTSVGAAVVASKGMIYDECCADGCGLLADTEDEWFEALDGLVQYPEARYNLVQRAQEKLVCSHSVERLREELMDVFSRAHKLHNAVNLRQR
jgi:hypothetical protein